MKMMKRFTSVLLVLCMVLSLVPAITFGASAASYTKATSIAVGDTVVLVCESKTTELNGISSTSTKYGMQVAYSGSPAGAMALEVVAGTTSGSFAFKNGSNYLSWSSGNSLTTATSVTANSSWTVTFDASGNAVIKNVKDSTRQLQYNSGSPRFACYTSAQTAVQLYKGESSGAACSHTNTTTTTVDATCTATGSTTVTCDDCGQTISTTTIPVIDHNYVSGTCSMCGAADPSASTGDYSGRYYIAAIRTSGNYFYMTNDLGTASTKRYQAVDSGLTTLPASIASAEANKIFVLQKNADGTYLLYAEGISGDNKYLGYTSGNSGTLVAVASALNLTVTPNGSAYNIHFTASDAERYLALNGTSGTNYFAWYKSGQKQDLTLIPVSGTSSCSHTNTTTTTVDATCTTPGSTTVTCDDCGQTLSTTTIPVIDHNYVDGTCSVCGAADPGSGESGGEEGGDTTVTTVATIKIITGIGKAWFVDGEGNKYALRDDSHNPLGTEATEKAQVYRADVPTNGTITLVLQPDTTQRLACIEKSSDRLEPSAYPYDSANGYFTYTFTASATTTNNYFRITFLPRLADGGYTAVQATESATGAAITPGIYVMTGLRTPETYTTNAHSVDTTYLLYADTYTVVDDSNAAVGRKSSALQLSSVGVFLNTEDPYLMTAVNKNHLVNIQTSGDHYTIGLVGAEGYYLKAISGNNLNATNNLSDSGVLWDITYLSDGAYKIVNVDTGRTLLFNSAEANLQFRAYNLATSSLKLAENAPILYRAAKASQLVTYTVTSGTGTGSIYANNNSTASAVASGTYQTIDSELTFTFTPAFGYQLASVTVNGTAVEVNEDGTYTCTVEEGTDIHVEASYELIPATNNITVYFYVNGEQKDRLEATVANSYVLDLSTLGDVTVVNPVTNTETTYSYKDLSFSLSQVEREDAVVSTYYDLLSTILVQDGDVIRAYFTTTEVTLNKTAIETTDKNTTVNDANGGLNLENFTDTNNTDPNGNVKQTFEITLNAQSFSTGADKIEGNTDVILVLDNSNSMHHKDAGATVSGYLSACSSTADSLSIVEELDNDSIWTINFTDGVATVRTVGAYTHNTLGFDATNNVFGAYTSTNSLVGVTLWRYDETANSNAGGWKKVTSEDQLVSGDRVAILDADTTNYGMNNYLNENGQFTTVDTSSTIPSAITFTLAKASYEDSFIYSFNSAGITLAGKTNSEYTLAALDKFYDTVFSVPGNRVGVVKFETEAFAWNGSSFVAYNGSQNPSNYSLTYESCFMSTKAAAQAASDAAIANQETGENAGATNMVGAWLMTYTMCNLFDGTNGRNLVIVFFTDGVPTATYVTDEEGYWSTPDTEFQAPLSSRTFTSSIKVYAGHGTTTSGTLAAGTYGFIHGGGGGADTSAVEYSDALYLAQAVRSKLETKFGERFAIHNIGLFNEGASEDEQIEYPELIANLLCAREYDSNGNLSNQTKQWNSADYPASSQTEMTQVLYIPDGDTYYHYIRSTDDPVSYYNYADAGAYLNDSTKWVDTDPYADSYVSVTGNVDAELKDAFDSIAVSITPGKKVQGTIEDTIPAGFKLTDDSKAELEADGWTVTVNDDGTTTIVKPNVIADADGESFTYEIEYQGDGYGAVYTNVQAKYIYEGVDDNETYESYFPMPVVDVIPWTVNDGYTADTNVAVTLDVMKNDLFEALTAGGYIVGNLTVTLTDANGTPTTYLGAEVGAFDAVVDPASNTVSFVTEVGGNSTFYYVVSAEVTAPDGTVTTVYSRATRVDVLTVSAENISDVDVAMAGVGDSVSVDLLANDHFESGDYTTENSVVLTDANGNELTSSTIGILTNVSVNEDTGVLTYTAEESGVEQFWYVNTVTATDSNGNSTSVSTPPTKVTILVVDDAVLVVDYGYTTEALQVHADLTAYTVADGVTLADVVNVTYPTAANGTYGAASFNNGAFTFTPATTMFGGLDIFTYTVKITKNTYNVRTATYEPTVTVVPANSVHYEESFLNYATTGVDLNGNALTTWSDEGTAADRKQSTENALYGNDAVYAIIESYSGNSGKLATVTEANPTAVAYFNFTGTGFDLYGLSSQDTGFLLAEIYTYDASAENNLGTIKKYVMVDTYIQGKTYEQLPILGCRDLPYGDYAVKLRVVYEKAFDHNLPATKNEGIKNEEYYRQLLGLQAGVPMELSLNETATPATRNVPAATLGSYSIVLDGIRIYQPLNASPADALANSLYSEAGELGANFYRVRDLLLSADAWADAAGNVNGVVYIAADANYTGADNQDSSIDTDAPTLDDPTTEETEIEGVYLTPTQSFKLDESNYLVDPATGSRAVINVDGTDYEIYVVIVDGEDGGKRNEYCYNNGTEEVVISAEQIEAMGLMHAKNYYEAIGPKYELYLTNGNGIAFNVGADKLLHLSMKLPVGETATLQAYVDGQWIDAATVSSRTELYYDLSSCVNADGNVILKCAASADAVLSLCNIKTMNAPTTSRSAVYMAAAALNGLEVESEGSFKISHSVSFDSDLKMNYRIKYSDLETLVPNYVTDGAYLVVEKDRYPMGGGITTVETVTLYPDLTTDAERMIFVLNGIQSVEMGSELRAVLHVFDENGNEYTTPVDVYSILDYARSCFSKYTYEEQPEFYTLLIDTLNYGAAAQVTFDRRANELVNAGMDAYQRYATTELSAQLTDVRTYVDNDRSITAVTAMGFNVTFADKTEINAKLTLAEGYTKADITAVKVLDESGNLVATLTQFIELADGRIQVTFSDIKSVNMRDMYYFVAYIGEEVASQNVGYSVEAYAKSCIASGDSALAELAMATICYGDSAKAYFESLAN